MSVLSRAGRRLATAALKRTGHLDQARDARRRWRDGATATRVWWLSRRLQRQLGTQRRPHVSRDGLVLMADVESRYVAHERMLDNLQTVSDALAGHGVEFALCPIPSVQRYRLVIDEADRERVWQALTSRDAPASTYVAFDGNSQQQCLPMAACGASIPAAGVNADVWLYFRTITDGTTAVIGPEHACEMEFWRRREPKPPTEATASTTERQSVLHASRRNLASQRMPPDARIPEAVVIAGRRIPSWQPFADVFSSQRQRFPVDVVYTWVDDSDPDWTSRRNRFATEASLRNADGNCPNRFANRDELRYSLRSLESFTDFVRHVYIVTDQQRPSWLADSGDVTIVDHSEIFDEDAALPTFNSHAIESRLHHIDGLSEHYLYMNDDILFGRRATVSSFFEPSGIIRFFRSNDWIPPGGSVSDDPSVDSAAKNGRALLLRSHGYVPTHKLKHVPHPQRRSTLFEMESLYAEEFKMVQQSRFRSPCDISVAASLHPNYSYITGRAVPSPIKQVYIGLARNDLEHALNRVADGEWDAICLNDTGVPDSRRDEVDRMVGNWLSEAYPFPSRYELPRP